jgi:hypothetical protein
LLSARAKLFHPFQLQTETVAAFARLIAVLVACAFQNQKSKEKRIQPKN